MKYIIKNESKVGDDVIFLKIANIIYNGTVCYGKLGKIYSQMEYTNNAVIYSDVTKNGTYTFTVKDRQIKLKGG